MKRSRENVEGADPESERRITKQKSGPSSLASGQTDFTSDNSVPSDEELGRGELDVRPKTKLKKRMQAAAKAYQSQQKKRGVVYLSRVPPYMKPMKVRDILSVYGTVTNIYLVAEDKSFRRQRKKSGGNTRKRYTEGWIEFENKKLAKRIAESLNNTKVGGKKRSYYYDDIWNLKYLKSFKWRHLTEKISYDRRMRETKLNAEMAKATRENNAYIDRVEQAKLIKRIEQRKGVRSSNKRSPENGGSRGVQRHFKQTVPVHRSKGSEERSFKSFTLSKVFSSASSKS
jgi:ESF2/ABP1 family protein